MAKSHLKGGQPLVPFDSRALQVIERLEQAGHRAVLVGGCVRDWLLGISPHDYDAATSALPQEILSVCSKWHCVETGIAHGTITVLCDGLSVEVTTFRRESTYSDHRHPDAVAFTPHLEEDLKRRDFTVNAMAWGRDGLVDCFGGQNDLKHRQIRCVGDPNLRFQEDALRILRGLRLAAQLDFHLHPETSKAIHCSLPLLSHVAWERISAEWIRLLCSPAAGRILLDFPDAATQVIPELTPCVGFDQHSPYHCFDVYTHSVRAMEQVPPVPSLRLAALLHDVGKPACFSLDESGIGHFYGHSKVSSRLAECALNRLRLEKGTAARALLLISRHHLSVEPTRQWAGRWLTRLGPEVFFQLIDLKAADAAACSPSFLNSKDALLQVSGLARQILSKSPCLSLKDLAVNGRDAIAAGLSGPAIGTALRTLLEEISEGHLPNERPILLTRLAQMAK